MRSFLSQTQGGGTMRKLSRGQRVRVEEPVPSLGDAQRGAGGGRGACPLFAHHFCMPAVHNSGIYETPAMPWVFSWGRADQLEPCPDGSLFLESLQQIVLALLALHATLLGVVHPSLCCPNLWLQCFLGEPPTPTH